MLEATPSLGAAYPHDSPLRACRHLLVVVRVRRWAHRITYEIRGNIVWIRYIYPAWYPVTHPDFGL